MLHPLSVWKIQAIELGTQTREVWGMPRIYENSTLEPRASKSKAQSDKQALTQTPQFHETDPVESYGNYEGAGTLPL